MSAPLFFIIGIKLTGALKITRPITCSKTHNHGYYRSSVDIKNGRYSEYSLYLIIIMILARTI